MVTPFAPMLVRGQSSIQLGMQLELELSTAGQLTDHAHMGACEVHSLFVGQYKAL